MERKDYYNATYILLEIVKQLKGKETIFLEKGKNGTVIRGLKAHYLDMLKKHFEVARFDKHNYNIYNSLLNFENLPAFSYSPSIRKDQLKNFRKLFINYAKGYDWGIDFDGKSPNDEICYQQVKKLKSIFDKYKLPYQLKFSGSKGFHFIIENRYLPNISIQDKCKMLEELTLNLKIIYKLHKIDHSIYDLRRIFKTAYSLDNSSGEELIVLPLNDSQFKNFNIDMVKLKNVHNVRMKNRGLLTRNLNHSIGVLRSNFMAFRKDHID